MQMVINHFDSRLVEIASGFHKVEKNRLVGILSKMTQQNYHKVLLVM
jgi:hypothetical protein